MAGGNITLDELQGALNTLSKPVERRVNALMNLHDQYLEAYKSYQKEVRALEAKYLKEKFTPLFSKRSTIITGAYEPTDAEAEYSREDDEEEEKKEEKKEEKPEKEEKGIPNFWVQALQNDNMIASAIFENDHEALDFLTDIRSTNFESAEEIGFKLEFQFAENPFFTNTVLTKRYILEEDEMFAELNIKSIEGCEINWKPGQNLTVKTVKKKVKSKGAKGKKAAAPRVVSVEEPTDSFFQFFSPPTLDDDEEDEDQDPEDDEAMQALQDKMAKEEQFGADFDIGTKIKDAIVPYAVLWFTGEAADYYGEEEEEDYDGEFGDEDDDEEDDEDEDEDEEEAPKRGPKGGKRGAAHAFAPPAGGKQSSIPQPQQPECKQQ